MKSLIITETGIEQNS